MTLLEVFRPRICRVVIVLSARPRRTIARPARAWTGRPCGPAKDGHTVSTTAWGGKRQRRGAEDDASPAGPLSGSRQRRGRGAKILALRTEDAMYTEQRTTPR